MSPKHVTEISKEDMRFFLRYIVPVLVVIFVIFISFLLFL